MFFAYLIGYNLANDSLYNITNLKDFATQEAYVKAHTAQTMAFMVLGISQLVHAFNVRSTTLSTFKLKKNKYLLLALFISLTLQTLTLLPGLRDIFSIILIKDWRLWLIVIGLSIMPLVIVEMIKLIKRKLQ